MQSIEAGPFQSKLSDLLKNLGHLKPLQAAGLGGKIWQLIKDALGNIDLSGMTKDEFLKKVDEIYDSMVAPAILGIGPVGVMINPILNAVVLALAGKFYDNHSKPATA